MNMKLTSHLPPVAFQSIRNSQWYIVTTGKTGNWLPVGCLTSNSISESAEMMPTTNPNVFVFADPMLVTNSEFCFGLGNGVKFLLS
jgi:hypothetical protein